MIAVKSASWTEEEKKAAILVFRKAGFCFQQVRPEDYPLPPDIYNAWAGAIKIFAVELVLFQGKEIYLIRRPSEEEQPEESWPGKLHIPGCTVVPYETSEQAMERLITTELGGVKIGLLKVVGAVDYHPVPRAPVTTLLYAARMIEQPKNEKGEFYPVDWALETDEIVSFHRELLIPRALDSVR